MKNLMILWGVATFFCGMVVHAGAATAVSGSLKKGTDNMVNLVNFPIMSIPVFIDGYMVSYYRIQIAIEAESPTEADKVRQKMPRLVDTFFTELSKSMPLRSLTKNPFVKYHSRLQSLSEALLGKKNHYLHVNKFETVTVLPHDASAFVTGSIGGAAILPKRHEKVLIEKKTDAIPGTVPSNHLSDTED